VLAKINSGQHRPYVRLVREPDSESSVDLLLVVGISLWGASSRTAVGAAYLLLIAARAFVNPKGFAAYLGLPLPDPADTGFVSVYAARPLVGHLDVLNGQGLPAAPAGTAARPGLSFLGYTVSLSGALHDVANEAVRIGRTVAHTRPGR
jgi:hypothetical protein